MINNVTLVGRLAADPAVKEFEGGVKVANFSLAVEKTYKNKDGEKDVNFINIVAWRKTAEIAEKYLKKGSLCGIAGSIETRNYEDSDGVKHYVTEVLASELQLLPSSGN